MNAAGTISDCVVDIGVHVVKDKIKDAHEEAQIRRKLHDYLDRQHKYKAQIVSGLAGCRVYPEFSHISTKYAYN